MKTKVHWDNISERFNVISEVYKMSKYVFYEKIKQILKVNDKFDDFFDFIQNCEKYSLNLNDKPFKSTTKEEFMEIFQNKKEFTLSEKIVLYYYFKEVFN